MFIFLESRVLPVFYVEETHKYEVGGSKKEPYVDKQELEVSQ